MPESVFSATDIMNDEHQLKLVNVCPAVAFRPYLYFKTCSKHLKIGITNSEVRARLVRID